MELIDIAMNRPACVGLHNYILNAFHQFLCQCVRVILGVNFGCPKYVFSSFLTKGSWKQCYSHLIILIFLHLDNGFLFCFVIWVISLSGSVKLFLLWQYVHFIVPLHGPRKFCLKLNILCRTLDTE